MEIWKSVKGYEGVYEVSNLGNVKSLSRIKYYKNYNFTIGERILKTSKSNNGYLSVTLAVNKTKKNYLVHRLVADAFIDNNENKPTVNHINGVKTDNRAENLEWSTYKENTNHAHKSNLCGKGITHHNSKQVICLSTLTVYESISDASKKLNIKNLGAMLNGVRKNYTTLAYLNENTDK